MRIAIVIGTRPEIIKMSPLVIEAKEQGIEVFLIHSNQHYDENMSSYFYSVWGISPDFVSVNEQDWINEIKKRKINDVFVHGDTDTTFRACYCAKRNGMNVYHVESGLRCHDKFMYEEMNRIMVDHISDFLYAPSNYALNNLKKEGLSNCIKTGNTIISSLEKFSIVEKEIKNRILITIHRKENTDCDCFLKIIKRIIEIKNKGFEIVFPCHPRTSNRLREINKSLYDEISNIMLAPMNYIDFLKNISSSEIILTDSGGVMEEAAYYKKPCIVIRDFIERQEILCSNNGNVILTDEIRILKSLDLASNMDLSKFKHPYGNNAEKKIIKSYKENKGG